MIVKSGFITYQAPSVELLLGSTVDILTLSAFSCCVAVCLCECCDVRPVMYVVLVALQRWASCPVAASM